MNTKNKLTTHFLKALESDQTEMEVDTGNDLTNVRRELVYWLFF